MGAEGSQCAVGFGPFSPVSANVTFLLSKPIVLPHREKATAKTSASPIFNGDFEFVRREESGRETDI